MPDVHYDDLKFVKDVLERGAPATTQETLPMAIPGVCLVALGVKGLLTKPVWADYRCVGFGLFVAGLFVVKFLRARTEREDLARAKAIVTRMKETP